MRRSTSENCKPETAHGAHRPEMTIVTPGAETSAFGCGGIVHGPCGVDYGAGESCSAATSARRTSTPPPGQPKVDHVEVLLRDAHLDAVAVAVAAEAAGLCGDSASKLAQAQGRGGRKARERLSVEIGRESAAHADEDERAAVIVWRRLLKVDRLGGVEPERALGAGRGCGRRGEEEDEEGGADGEAPERRELVEGRVRKVARKGEQVQDKVGACRVLCAFEGSVAQAPSK
ncbi:hypothetical protein Rhopal_003467-T1 [Rhodotorula paludigena]|uniref:Uncharacterized protein n=1 Tax=Rhodotorula paludigena TaxID=86838 RepID=A0AAV5GD85_9BASI|nr:hypothetical protein Rhopal_003467-T1 [Rhodotorula paludigena]